MGRVLTRSQLGRVTQWFLSHHHHHPPPSSSTTSIISFIKHCTTTTKTATTTTTTENVASSSEKQKKTLPEHIVRLICRSPAAESGFCEVYLVGTVHTSQRSCAEVQTAINFLKPEVVFLELCKKRQSVLTTKHLKEPTVEEMIAMIRTQKTNIFGLLIRLFYTLIAKELKIIPGSEFRVAYEEAMKYGGKVVLGDRPIEITLTRAWRKMPLIEKIRLFSLHSGKDGSTEDYFPSMKDCSSSLTDLLLELCTRSDEMDMDTVTRRVQEMRQRSPTLAETLIHERDLYMSSTLLQVARKSRCVVAVVGKAHLEGIKKHWQQPLSVSDLLTVPPPKHTARILISVAAVMAGVAMIWRCL